jgi:hypothetical protein
MMTAHERNPKNEACLGGHWLMTRRSLGPFCLRLDYFIDSVGKFGNTT